MLSLSNFLPLKRCTRLESLFIKLDSQLPDPAFEELISSWPRLERFRWSGNTETTISVLESIAKHCPRATECTVRFTGTVIPHGPYLGPVQTSLRTLYVDASTINDAGETSLYLALMFPGLCQIEQRSRFHSLGVKWTQVAKLLCFGIALRDLARQRRDAGLLD